MIGAKNKRVPCCYNYFDEPADNTNQHKALLKTEKLIVERLSERERLIIKLYYEEKRSNTEIAEMLKVNKSTVCREHKKALKKIHDYLQYCAAALRFEEQSQEEAV